MTQPTEQVVALFNYAGTSPTDICFKKGETISIIQRKSDWAEGEANGKKGWFPLSYVEQPDRSPRAKNPAEAADSIVESKDKTKASLGEFFAARGASKSDFKTKLVEKNIIVTENKEKEKEKDKDSASKKSSSSALKKLRRGSERRKEKKEEKKESSGSSESLLAKSPQADSYFYSKRDSEANSPAMTAAAAVPELTDKEKAKAEKEKKKKTLNNFFAKRMSASRPKPRVVEEDKDKGGVCGMTLAQLASLQKDHVTEVPLVITLLIDFISAHGFDVEGIFRIAGNAYKVDDLSKMFASSSLSTIGGINPSTDAHVCGELLKKILRDLPEPIFTYKLHDDFIQTTNIDNREERIAKMRELYLQLPPVNGAVLKALFAMMIPVAYSSSSNLMTVENLSTVFGPTLLRRKEMDFLSGLNDRSKDVVYNLLLDYDPIINNKPNPEDHDTKLFPVVKKANVVRPEHMMAATSPRADSSGSLKPSASQESISAASDKEESKVESSSEKKEEKEEVKPAEPSPRSPLPRSTSQSDDLTELREPSGEEPK